MTISRRAFGATLGTVALAGGVAQTAQPKVKPFRISLNTSTVRNAEGKSRPIVELIEIAQKAGYDAIEPWVAEIQDYLKTGGTTADLKKRIADAGLIVPDAIGFAEWIVDDPARRAKALDNAKRDMELVQAIGGQRIAAPPIGATTLKADEKPIDLLAAADRYHALFEIGKAIGITPIVEIWGFSKTCRRLGEALLIAAESRADGAAILPDIYHLYKGGSDFGGLKLIRPETIGIFHVNDYPKIDREKITDADRVYPGDGLAPWPDIITTLKAIQYQGILSIELFNRTYWKQNPHEVASTAIKKLKAIISDKEPRAK